MQGAAPGSRVRAPARARVSVWLDDLSGALLGSGALEHYITEHALSSVTSNPTIFAHALRRDDHRYGHRLTRRPGSPPNDGEEPSPAIADAGRAGADLAAISAIAAELEAGGLTRVRAGVPGRALSELLGACSRPSNATAAFSSTADR